MPDIKKNIKFKEEQQEIILNDKTFTLYELDNDEKKNKKK